MVAAGSCWWLWWCRCALLPVGRVGQNAVVKVREEQSGGENNGGGYFVESALGEFYAYFIYGRIVVRDDSSQLVQQAGKLLSVLLFRTFPAAGTCFGQ